MDGGWSSEALEVFGDDSEFDPVGESVIIDSLETISPSVQRSGGFWW